MYVIDFILLGYVEIKIHTHDFEKLANHFLRRGIRMTSKSDNLIIVFMSQKDEAIKILTTEQIDFDITREFQIFGTIKSKRESIVIFSVFLFTVFLVLFLSNLVWCIEVDGNDNISDADIVMGLEECGFHIGSRWSKTDFGEIENAFLNRNSDIGWININRSGTVAYVTVIEAKNAVQDDSQNFELCNLVAKEDCVIEYISVTNGTAVVKAGDVVRKGDPLILGINNNENGSEFCAAEGTVIGRVSKIVGVDAKREKLQKSILDTSLCASKIKIFDFSINIFKKYRNFGMDCVIIEKKNKISLPNGRKLPFEVINEYETRYSETVVVLGDEELVCEARYKMNITLQKLLPKVHLNSIRTYGNFTDEGYKMFSELIYSCDVSESINFSVD